MALNKVRQYGKRVIPTLKDKIEFTDIVNDSTTGGTAKPLSAEAGKVLRADLNQEITDRGQSIVDLKGDVSVSNNTLGKLEDSLEQEVADRQNAITQEVADRDAAILVETNRAKAKEAELQANMDAQSSSASNDLDAEIARAVSEEQRIEARLDSQIVSSNTKFATLNGDSDVAGSIDQKVKVESDRALVAETTLQSNIDGETSRAIAAEGVLDGKIGSITATVNNNKTAIETALTNESNARLSADVIHSDRLTAIETIISAGVSWKGSVADMATLDALVEADLIAGQAYYVTAEKDVYVVLGGVDGDYKPDSYTSKSFLKIADFTELTGLVNAEKNRALTAENGLQAAITAETASRQADKAEVMNAIADEESARLASVQTVLDAVSAEQAARIADVDSEEQRAINAEAILTSNITRLDADSNVVDSVAYKVEQEKIRAVNAEGTITTNLNTEISNRTNAVNTEKTRAMTAESNLDSKINTEISDRQEAITNLSNVVSQNNSNLDARLDVIEGDKLTVGSVAYAEYEAKKYADKWIPMAKLEGTVTPLNVVGDSITLTYAPMIDGIVMNEVIVYKVDSDGTNEAIAVNVLSVTGSVVTLDTVNAGEFDGCTAKVHYFFKEAEQGGAGMGVAGEGGAGA